MTSVAETVTGTFGTDPVVLGLVGDVFIALLNLLGASLVLVWRDPSERSLDSLLGFAAGVMLSASFTSLILPGIEFADVGECYAPYSLGGVEIAGVYPVVIGLVLGVLFLDRADALVPHAHYTVGQNV
jgi:ZIP family zinc transporter